jgi:hypothetical protein
MDASSLSKNEAALNLGGSEHLPVQLGAALPLLSWRSDPAGIGTGSCGD